MTTNPRARILIVEDSAPIRMLLHHLLCKRFEVQLANSVDSALQRAGSEHFDLFLLDINLGEDRTGVDLLGLLREMPGYRATPAVACTAYAGPRYREKFLANGFNEYVDKPFSRPILLSAIEEALESACLWGRA